MKGFAFNIFFKERSNWKNGTKQRILREVSVNEGSGRTVCTSYAASNFHDLLVSAIPGCVLATILET